MGMKSFSYEHAPDMRMFYEIWTEITKLKRYFHKYNIDVEEAMLETFQHALKHYDPDKGELLPYLKNLARNASKNNKPEVACDFLEETVVEEIGGSTGSNIVQDILDEIEIAIDKKEEIAKLALSHMSFFNLFCESVINRDSTTRYFPETFISEVLKISKQSKGFNKDLLDIYEGHKNGLANFIGADVSNEGVWREADFEQIKKCSSKRVFLCDKTGSPLTQDTEDLIYYRGNLEGKAVLAVGYYDLYNSLCDLLDAETSPSVLRYDICNNFIVRSLGGSLSIVNPRLTNMYSLFRNEIVTNVLYDLCSRYLACTERNIYVMANKSDSYSIADRKIKGLKISLDVTDITEHIIKIK